MALLPCAAIGTVLLAGLVVTAAAAPFVSPHPEPELPTIAALDALVWDPGLANSFDWSLASPKIPTACMHGRTPFASSVAQLDCLHSYDPGRGGLDAFRGLGPLTGGAFASVSADTERGPAGTTADAASPSTARLAAPAPNVGNAGVVPVPAAAWLLLPALGGLAALRHRSRTYARAHDRKQR